jgi:hypothetical protein
MDAVGISEALAAKTATKLRVVITQQTSILIFHHCENLMKCNSILIAGTY